jgi:hypothetical protein
VRHLGEARHHVGREQPHGFHPQLAPYGKRRPDPPYEFMRFGAAR